MSSPSSSHARIRGPRAARRFSIALLVLVATLVELTPAFAGDPCSGGTGPTVITVNTTSDPTPTSMAFSCNDLANTGVVSANADGLCSFRRALIEVGYRLRSERPFLIEFEIDTGESGYDATTETWTLLIDEALPDLKDQLSAPGSEIGCVTIDGDSQPGGRPAIDGPRIFLDDGGGFGGWSIPVFSSNNTFTNLGLMGGIVIQLGDSSTDEAHETLIDNLWIGLDLEGQSIVLQSPGQPSSLAFGGGVFIDTNNNIVRNSVITGAFGRAIDINGGTTGNIIQNNFFGTRADGTLPLLESTNVATATCDASFDYNTAENWYGGWGISIGGTGQIIQGNTFAGMQNLRSANDTAPVAIETFGNDHVISMNAIGVDSNLDPRGVCGQAIKVSDGQGTDVLDNLINKSRASFLTLGGNVIDAAILVNHDQFGDTGEVTVRRNLLFNGPGDLIAMGPAVPDSLRLFTPPVVTSISGTQVLGQTSPGSNCVGCTIDLYSDNGDPNQEAFEYLGSTAVAANGTFQFTLAAPLAGGLGIRVTATTDDASDISGFGAGTTTEAGEVFVDPDIFADGFEGGNTSQWTSTTG